MFWTWTLSFVLVCSSSAFKDEPDMGQRSVTIDLDDVAQEPRQMDPCSQTMDICIQRPLEGWELLDRISHSRTDVSDMTQREVTFDLIPEFPTGGRPVAGPRSFGKSNPSVVFPPGQPNPDNLQAICLHSSRRPRYPASFFPRNSFGYMQRQGDAVNRVESWYSTCCHGNWTQQVNLTLCCVRQAWEQSISTFCEEEFSVKTSHYFCCRKKEEDRHSCFHEAAPNPTYMPITEETGFSPDPEPGFTFDPNTCHSPPRSQAVPRGVRENLPEKTPQGTHRDSDISFPPGRPTSQNIGLVCRLVNHQLFYKRKCLQRSGYGWLAPKLKAMRRLEGAFRRCCGTQGDVLACADQRWREVLDRFCKDEVSKRGHITTCCDEGEQRYSCFSNSAPHPAYDRELLSAPAAQTPTLGHVCETQKIIKKKFVFFPIQSIVGLCCIQPSEQRTSCIEEQLVMHAESWCSAKQNLPSTVASTCCLGSSQDRPKCFSDLLIKVIAKAIKSPPLKKCPPRVFL